MERLEERRLLTNYVVDTLEDIVAVDGKVSLREAVYAANSGLAQGDAPPGQSEVTDRIRFSESLAGGTIILNGTLIDISESVDIEGLGADRLAISGGGLSQIFYSTWAGRRDAAVVRISGLTLKDGAANGTAGDPEYRRLGGAIYNGHYSFLTLTDVVLTGNTASHSGGAVHSNAWSSIDVVRCTFSQNVAAGFGGGLDSQGDATVTDSTFSGNAGSGGGLHQSGGDLVVSNSTFSGNSSFSGATPAGVGGGVWLFQGSARLTNVTIVGNRSGNRGGGLLGRESALTEIVLENTLIAGNVRGAGAGSADDLTVATGSGSTYNGRIDTLRSFNNLIGDAETAGGLANGTRGNVVGVDWRTVVDSVLSNHGGSTQTHALLAGGAAVNAGSNALAIGPGGGMLAFDQRGAGFARVLRGTVDIGAFEWANASPVARNDAVATGEASAVAGSVFADNGSGVDSDPDGDGFTVTAVNGVTANVGSTITLASGATLIVNADGSFNYDPNGRFVPLSVGESATEAFTYEVGDGSGGVSTATVTVTVVGANDAPAAAADAVRTNESAVASGDLLANDSDIDGDVLTVSAVNGSTAAVGTTVTLASEARLRVNANGNFSYDPNGRFVRLRRGETATDSFTYTASDGHGGTATATVIVTIHGGGGEADLVGFLNGGWWVSRSTGAGFAAGERWASWSPTGWDALGQGDFDGDGLTDVFGLRDGAWWVGRSTGAAFAAPTVWGRWSDRDWQDVRAADLNGDGKDDILARVGGNWWGALANASGTGFGAYGLWGQTSVAAWQRVSAEDFNGDGKADLVGFANGRWLGRFSTGTAFGAETLWSSWVATDWKGIVTADLNGDGRLDIAGLRFGTWWVGLGRTSGPAGFTAPTVRAGWANAAWENLVAGDFDDDGRDDLAARLGGTWWISRSNAAGGQASQAAWGGGPAGDWRDVRVADFDGDGRDDVAWRLNGAWRVGRSTGTAFAVTAWGGWANGPTVNWQAVGAADANGSEGLDPGDARRDTQPPRATLAASGDEPLVRFWRAVDEDEELAGLLAGL